MRYLFVLALAACADAPLGALDAACVRDGECGSGVCIDQVCVDAAADYDGDGLANGDEVARGLDPSLADTDRDGVRDDLEGGHDTDGDGLDDALEDRIGDSDGDCIVDELDPANLDFDEAGCATRVQVMDVAFIPALDTIVCRGETVALSQSAIEVRAGTFDDAWVDSLRASGALDGEGITGTLACEDESGSFEARRVGAHYEGAFSFGDQAGIVFVSVADPRIGAAWFGLVLDPEQRPIGGATIRVALDPEAATTSQPDGRFYLETAVDAEVHAGAWTTITVEAEGFAPYSAEIPVGSGVIGVYTRLTPDDPQP